MAAFHPASALLHHHPNTGVPTPMARAPSIPSPTRRGESSTGTFLFHIPFSVSGAFPCSDLCGREKDIFLGRPEKVKAP